jgi:hypothetical protein
LGGNFLDKLLIKDYFTKSELNTIYDAVNHSFSEYPRKYWRDCDIALVDKIKELIKLCDKP